MSTLTKNRTIAVPDRRTGSAIHIFYREAGPVDAPAILLLHGFPASSHQYRGLIASLAEKYRVIVPDLPGFGFSDAPEAHTFGYTFDRLAEVIEDFTDIVKLTRYALYVFDYGAPVGFRLALSRPDRIAALISQNGNAYEEGLSDAWHPIRAYWQDPSEDNRANLRNFLKRETTIFQYTHGERDISLIAPESYTLDQYFLDRTGSDEIQLDLFADYQTNVTLYPRFQEYFRKHRPPMLAVWGKNDPFFLPRGAEAFRRDLPDAEIHLVDAGHFALETHLDEIARILRAFLARTIDTAQGPALFGELNAGTAPAAAGELMEDLGDVFGFVPNLAYALAAEPSVIKAYNAMLQAITETQLEPVAQQVALAAASWANAAHYGVASHSTVAARLGAPADIVEALRAGSPLKDDKLEAVRRFAAAIASKGAQVSDSDVNQLTAAGYDRRAALAIALAAGAATLANTVAHLSRPEPDAGFRPE